MGGRDNRVVLLVSVVNLLLTLFLYVLLYLAHEDLRKSHDNYERTHRNVIWEVNRQGQILSREGLAKPADQLGIAEPVPNEGEPKP